MYGFIDIVIWIYLWIYVYVHIYIELVHLCSRKPESPKDKNGETLNLLPKSHIEYTSINNLSYGEEDVNYNKLKENMNGKTRAIEEVLETVSHDIKLFGDFDLNPVSKSVISLCPT